jgi:hypothetical protein
MCFSASDFTMIVLFSVYLIYHLECNKHNRKQRKSGEIILGFFCYLKKLVVFCLRDGDHFIKKWKTLENV